MLTSKPQPKHRGRQPPKHDKYVCPWCVLKTRRSPNVLGLFCVCKWREGV